MWDRRLASRHDRPIERVLRHSCEHLRALCVRSNGELSNAELSTVELLTSTV